MQVVYFMCRNTCLQAVHYFISWMKSTLHFYSVTVLNLLRSIGSFLPLLYLALLSLNWYDLLPDVSLQTFLWFSFHLVDSDWGSARDCSPVTRMWNCVSSAEIQGEANRPEMPWKRHILVCLHLQNFHSGQCVHLISSTACCKFMQALKFTWCWLTPALWSRWEGAAMK